MLNNNMQIKIYINFLLKLCYVKIKWFCVISANKTLKEKCELNEQCTGTENGNTCRLVAGTRRKECSCNDQFEIIDGKCLKGIYFFSLWKPTLSKLNGRKYSLQYKECFHQKWVFLQIFLSKLSTLTQLTVFE